MTSHSDQTNAGNARGKLVQLMFGHLAAQAVVTAVEFGLADQIGDGQRSSDELAARSEADPQALLRLLRALAALGAVTEQRPGSFALTELGGLLRTDRPDSMHAFTRMFADPAMTHAWQRLDFSVRTGDTAFDEVFGTDFFDYLSSHPELSALFNAAMGQGSQATAEVVPRSYDFSPFRAVVDIGGGDGSLLASILRQHSHLTGVVFDTPDGSAQAEHTLRQANVDSRCSVQAGDFFTSAPSGGDLYVLKSVVHDWDDDRASTILGHVRSVLPKHGHVLLIEPILPETVDGSIPTQMYLSDLNMLVNVGGRERTHSDFAALCRRAGLNVSSVTPLEGATAFYLIDATPG